MCRISEKVCTYGTLRNSKNERNESRVIKHLLVMARAGDLLEGTKEKKKKA